ncbi:hypothetical protein SCB49_11447 [unidentified eubacterium SCB49]|nr:hypothetical protein SCB49_11447 [unidentified eubacterium SCB49]
MKFKMLLLICMITLSGFQTAISQSNSELTYNLEFIKAIPTDEGKNSVNAIFKITPKLKVDFPPVIGGKYTVDLNKKNNPEIIILSKQTAHKLSIRLFGKNEPDKPSKTYDIIKSLVNIEEYEDVLFFILEFKNITDIPIDKMYLKFGFWEKNNQDKRIEQEFEFDVE